MAAVWHGRPVVFVRGEWRIRPALYRIEVSATPRIGYRPWPAELRPDVPDDGVNMMQTMRKLEPHVDTHTLFIDVLNVVTNRCYTYIDRTLDPRLADRNLWNRENRVFRHRWLKPITSAL